MATSVTPRSMKRLRETGWSVHRVEYFNSFCHRRIDAFNFGDLLACHPQGKPTLIQVTTNSNMSARMKKAKEYAGPLVSWILSGGQLLIHGWAKMGGSGKRKLWTLTERPVTLSDLTAENGGEAS